MFPGGVSDNDRGLVKIVISLLDRGTVANLDWACGVNSLLFLQQFYNLFFERTTTAIFRSHHVIGIHLGFI